MIRFLSGIISALFKVLFLVNFILGLLLLYPLFYLFLSRKKWFPLAIGLKRFWGRWILLFPGILISKKDEAGVHTIQTPCIYCANHTSYLDIIISYLVIPGVFVFMGKAELLKAPLFRIFFTKGLDIAVDRKSRIGSHQAFLQAGKKLDNGESIFIFPEGTISSKGQLKAFKNGAFKLALEKQVPIVPITFHNNWKLLQNGGFFKSRCRPGIAKVTIHKPINTKGLSAEDLVTLRESVRNTIHAALHRN